MNNQDTRFANQYQIQWFPGHMTKTRRKIQASLKLVDAVAEMESHSPEKKSLTP